MSHTYMNEEEYLCFRRLGIAYGLGFILLSIFLVIVLLISEGIGCDLQLLLELAATMLDVESEFLTFHILKAVRAAVWIACMCLAFQLEQVAQ